MCAVSVFDKLTFTSRSDGQLRLKCRWSKGCEAFARANTSRSNPIEPESWLGDLPEGNSNIVLKAIERLRDYTGAEQGASIELVKRIPSEAGLGGASSDAAAALMAANHCWNVGWSRERLAEFAAELGSDIPFFFTGGSAVCRGRGERLEPFAACTKLDIVIVRPPEGLSTAKVYQHCDVADRPMQVDGLMSALRRGDTSSVGNKLVNRLQPAAEKLSSRIEHLRDTFNRLDCTGHQMSGSGTSYFGICRSARHARRVAGQLRSVGLGVVMTAATIRTPQQCL